MIFPDRYGPRNLTLERLRSTLRGRWHFWLLILLAKNSGDSEMTSRQANRFAVGFGLLGASVVLSACGGSTSVTGSEASSVPSFSISGPNGSIESGAELPANWPADVPTPTEIPLKQAVSVGVGMNASFSGPGDIVAIQAKLAERFKQNGFTTSGAFGGGGPSGGVSVYEKGNLKVQVTVLTQDGNVVVNEGVFSAGSDSPQN